MIYFTHCRTALKYGLIHLGFKPGDKILLPDYVCDVLLQPLKQLQLLPCYYSIKDGTII